MPVVTISRQTGSGGAEFAERLAHLLQYRLVDKAILAQVAALARVPVEQVEQFEATDESLLERFVHAVARSLPNLDDYYRAYAQAEAEDEHGARHYIYYGHDEGPADFSKLQREDCLRYFESAIRELADRGNVILVGRGSQVLLADFPHTLHLRITASQPHRVDRLAGTQGLDAESARQLMADQDEHRAAYLKVNYERDLDDAALYDVVFRMDHVDIDRATAFIRQWVVEETGKHESQLKESGPS